MLGITALHPDGDFLNGSMMWSAVADVVRPPRVVFLQGDESEVESNGESGRPPHVSAFVVATARQPARGPVLVFFTLSGVAWCCSGTLATGLACGMVCILYGTR